MNESFDQKAKTWDDEPRRIQLTERLFAAIEKAVSLGSDRTALDYGCGTGLLTLALAPRVCHITGVDTSQGMLKVLAQKARISEINNVDCLQSDFSSDPLPAGPYDLITSAMTLHHVADTKALLQKFFSLLESGGRLAIADIDTEDGSFHGHPEGIHHLGFDRVDLAQQLARCGFEEIRFTTATQIEKNERIYPVFLVTAQKL